jgi:predicted PurR-regulated permease PerM
MSTGALPQSPPLKLSGHPLTVIALCVASIAALYVGVSIFVPLVLAVLLTFALSPIVKVLHRIGLPSLAAVLITVAAAAVVISAVSFLIVSELAHLAGDIPKYQQIVTAKLQSLQQSTTSDGVFERIASGIQGAIASMPGTGGGKPPLPVTVVNTAEGPLAFGQVLLGSLLGPLATAAIVVVFVVCLLLEREDFRDRFLKLVSRGDLRTSTRAMSEAGRRVSRYLLVQLSINAVYGAVFGAGLYFIGIPDALLWGLLTAIFRYIPFVGTLIAACLPFALAVAIDPNWGMLIEVAVLFFGMELVVTNALEPRLYGSSTGLSALAVIIAAMFWATLWGPIGLILATPLTVCLVVLGRYVPQLQFLEILLGSEPVLVREEQLYQRLISGNTEEAINLAEQFVGKDGSLLAFYDEVAIPALRFAENDRSRDGTDLAGRRMVAEGMEAIAKEVEDSWPETTAHSGLMVLCIGGRTELDSAAAGILVQIFASQGAATRQLPPVSLRPQGIGQLDLSGVDVICLAYLDAQPVPYLRYAAKRIKRLSPTIKVIGCFFDAATPTDDAVREETGATVLVGSLAAAEAAVRALGETALENETPIRPGRTTNDFTAEVATEFSIQTAIVAAVDGPPADGKPAAATDLGLLRDFALLSDGVVVVPSTGDAEATAGNAFIVENGFGFFAAAKIMRGDEPAGVLMIFDHDHGDFVEADKQRLQKKASSFLIPIADDHVEPAPELILRHS